MVQTSTSTDTIFGLDVSDIKKSFISIRRKISKRFFLLEFGIDSLTYGEARVNKDQVFCSKINRVVLDKSAIEKGTPTNPAAMAEFLRQIIDEEQIWAHRVAITLPPESSLSRIIYLPEHLTHQEALDFIRYPSKSGFQYPIALSQTDFDIVPISSFPKDKGNATKPYFLSCIPSKVVDNIISTISQARLELHSLDIAYSSIGRLASSEFSKLESNQTIIILDLSLECSHLSILTPSGAVYVNALAAIREFKIDSNYTGNLSIEEATINSEDYHTISHLDLKVLISEIKSEIDKIKLNYKLEISEILLTGINSSHKGISNIFKDLLKINTTIIRSMSLDEIGDISYSKSLCIQELNRLIGLSLTMVESEDLILDQRDSKIDKNNKSNSNNSVSKIKEAEESLKNNFDKNIDLSIKNESNINELQSLDLNKSIQPIQLNSDSNFKEPKEIPDKINQSDPNEFLLDFEAENSNLNDSNSFPNLTENSKETNADKNIDLSIKNESNINELQSLDLKKTTQPIQLNSDSNFKEPKEIPDKINQSDPNEFLLDFEAENSTLDESNVNELQSLDTNKNIQSIQLNSDSNFKESKKIPDKKNKSNSKSSKSMIDKEYDTDIALNADTDFQSKEKKLIKDETDFKMP